MCTCIYLYIPNQPHTHLALLGRKRQQLRLHGHAHGVEHELLRDVIQVGGRGRLLVLVLVVVVLFLVLVCVCVLLIGGVCVCVCVGVSCCLFCVRAGGWCGVCVCGCFFLIYGVCVCVRWVVSNH
jgi:hypothetical protein